MAMSLAQPALSGSKPVPPPPNAGPEAFVRWVYGRYVLKGPSFDSQSVYSAELKALFSRNARLLHGEVGDNNDSDPVCQCQDWSTIVITRLVAAPEPSGRWLADVAFTNGAAHEALKLKLLRTPAGWRIDDVVHSDPSRNASLRANLVDENQRLAAGR